MEFSFSPNRLFCWEIVKSGLILWSLKYFILCIYFEKANQIRAQVAQLV
jgi:hypothetical protein